MPVVRYGDYADGADYSPRIWGHLGVENNPDRWNEIKDHFAAGLDLAASGSQGKWYGFIDTSDTIKTEEAQKNGAVVIATHATDNNGPCIAGSVTGANFAFQSGLPLAFEARWEVDSIATVSYFVGLAEEARAVDNGLFPDTQTAVADIDYVAFSVLGDTAASTVNFGYTTSGSTDVVAKAAAHTLVAGTYVKTGFRYDPYWDKIIAYVNGVPVAGQTTVRRGTTTFPDGEEMTVYAGLKNGSGAAREMTVCFMRCACAIW